MSLFAGVFCLQLGSFEQLVAEHTGPLEDLATFHSAFLRLLRFMALLEHDRHQQKSFAAEDNRLLQGHRDKEQPNSGGLRLQERI